MMLREVFVVLNAALIQRLAEGRIVGAILTHCSRTEHNIHIMRARHPWLRVDTRDLETDALQQEHVVPVCIQLDQLFGELVPTRDLERDILEERVLHPFGHRVGNAGPGGIAGGEVHTHDRRHTLGPCHLCEQFPIDRRALADRFHSGLMRRREPLPGECKQEIALAGHDATAPRTTATAFSRSRPVSRR